MIRLSDRDTSLVQRVRAVVEEALREADVSTAVTKRLFAIMAKHRNRGRKPAMRRHPFFGICEASGKPLAREHAHLDEIIPEQGYEGPVRWTCPRGNGSGRHTCGGCS